MDPSTYGRLVERGGYATGGAVNSPGFVVFGDGTPETCFELRGERGPELVWLSPGALVAVASSTVAGSSLNLDLRAVRRPDGGPAGVPARL